MSNSAVRCTRAESGGAITTAEAEGLPVDLALAGAAGLGLALARRAGGAPTPRAVA